MHHENTLAADRKRWALTQSEVGALLGLSADTIGNYELDERTPNVATALGLEIIFGKALAAMLPDALYEVATKMIPRLQAFSIELEGRTDEVTQLKQRLVNAIGDRLAHILPDA